MQLIMSLLGSPEVDQQETASRTLGELCRKNGERIFGEILPILQKAISSPDERTKEGACLAFADVMAASNKDVIADHEETIISAVRTALVDPSDVVRQAAAKTFDTMQHYMGAKAIDQTIPTLLEAMRSPGEGSETALQALQEVMSVSRSLGGYDISDGRFEPTASSLSLFLRSSHNPSPPSMLEPLAHSSGSPAQRSTSGWTQCWVPWCRAWRRRKTKMCWERSTGRSRACSRASSTRTVFTYSRCFCSDGECGPPYGS
jgi:hypothetical protein